MIALAPLGAASAASISFVPLTSTTVAPGGSFSFQIYGSSVNAIGLFSLYLTSSASNSQFQLTSYSINTLLFDDITLNPPLPEDVSSTHTTQDLGSFVTNPSGLASDTLYLLSTATITVGLGTPDGNYSLGNATTTVFTDPTFTFSDFAPESDLAINISSIPEPTTWGLLTAGGLAALIVARRFRRSAAV